MIYEHDKFDKLLIQTVEIINSLAEKKGGEYAGDEDRLANFRRNAEALGLNMEDVWSVYAAKHWDAIMQYVKDSRNGVERERLEPIDGRAHDLIVYLVLFLAMLDEKNDSL